MHRINIQLAEIPKGEITLRDDRIDRQWTVEIKAFLLSKYQVTQKQYFDITAHSTCQFQGENHPVENVSWKDAVHFCRMLSDSEGIDPDGPYGYRLPTEAEWEYACRAGTAGIRYGEIDKIAWYKSNSEGTTHSVGLKEPNPWGLYDMLGNVWEWCSDIYDETEYGSYRIFRGGGWNDEDRGCMATNRRRSHPVAFRIDDLGFRIARNFR